MSGTREIALTKGYVAVVDAADYEMLSHWSWSASDYSACVYAVRGFHIGRRSHSTSMHRMLMLPGPGEVVDHIDHDCLNNTRANLRVCRQAQNLWNSFRESENTSGFKGVSWHRRAGKWSAEITADGQKRYLGLFATREQAGEAYASAAAELHGDFARLAAGAKSIKRR